MNHRLVVRLVQVAAFFVGIPILYMIVDIVVQWRIQVSAPKSHHVTNAIMGIIHVALWWLIWRRDVTWSRSRVARTVTALAMTIGSSVLVALIIRNFWWPNAYLVLSWSFWAVLWLAATSIIWPDSPAERSERIADRTLPCPKCAYDLAGSPACTCPECGAPYTLDQIVAVAFEKRTIGCGP